MLNLPHSAMLEQRGTVNVGFRNAGPPPVRVGHRQAPARPVLKKTTPIGKPIGVLFFRIVMNCCHYTRAHVDRTPLFEHG